MKDGDGKTPSDYAAAYSNSVEVLNQLNSVKVIKDIAKHARDSLFVALKARDIDTAIRLIRKNPELSQDPKASFLLHQAAGSATSEVVSCMLDIGFDINFPDNFGWCPMHYAVKNQNMPVVRVLIERNALLDVRTREDYIPLHTMAKYARGLRKDSISIGRLLINAGSPTSNVAIRQETLRGAARRNALPLVGATIYFSILGLFMFVNDPRMKVHIGFERTFTDPDTTIRPYDIVISTRALVKSYFYLLPGILLIILTTSFLNSMTPPVNHDLITPVFALLGSWLLFGSAVYIQGNGRANSAWNTSIQGLIMFLRRNLLLYFALFFAFWLVLILMFRSFTSYQAGDPELPFLAYPIFGITVLVVTWVLGRLWPLLVLSFQKHPGDEQEGSGPNSYGVLDVWQWTAGYSSWLGCNMWVITALCLGVILPYIASISLDAGLLSVFMQGILFFIGLPLFSWVVADRGEALKKALSLP